jgi:hypothetical protein
MRWRPLSRPSAGLRMIRGLVFWGKSLQPFLRGGKLAGRTRSRGPGGVHQGKTGFDMATVASIRFRLPSDIYG